MPFFNEPRDCTNRGMFARRGLQMDYRIGEFTGIVFLGGGQLVAHVVRVSAIAFS